MMWWNDYGHGPHGLMGWPMWVEGLVLLVVLFLFLAGLAVLTVVLARGGGSRPQQPSADGHPTGAEQVLAERYARGELDEDEYRRRRDVLRSP